MKRLLLILLLGLVQVQAQVGVLDLADPVFLGGTVNDEGGGGSSEPPTTALLAHYEADSEVFTDAGTTPAADGEAVYQWNDQSGNGNHLTQTTSGDRPLYQTAEQNGLAGIQFVSTDFIGRAGTIFTNGPATVYVAAKVTDSTASGALLFDGENDTTAEYYALYNLSSATGVVRWWARNGATGDSYVETSTTYSTGTTYIFTGQEEASGAGRSVELNGAGTGNNSVAVGDTPRTSSTFRLGYLADSTPSNAFVGYIFEVLVYGAAHDATERAEVESYLTTKWGL